MIDLKQAFEDVGLTKRPLLINKKYFNDYMKKAEQKDYEWKDDGESFWLPMLAKNEEGEVENNGCVAIRIDIVPKEYAEKTRSVQLVKIRTRNPICLHPLEESLLV